ncbi:unnamed protein product [Cylicostephanus goldi]|uniref:Uncharacterized protein n=1 Tax=Cylicostephanus goldi TaxID=71465 RepID=A0A3P6STC1_CYLGO|nr:unnamed protein product [Cylicostephanus goldi]
MAKKQATKLPSTVKKQLIEEIAHFVEAHEKEAERRRKELTEKVDELYLQLRDDLFKASEFVLPESVLNENLYQFLDAASTEGSVGLSDDLPTRSSTSAGDLEVKSTELETGSVNAASQMVSRLREWPSVAGNLWSFPYLI